MYRWINGSITVLLAAVAVVITFFPPPQLPLRYLPAATAVVLAAMLIWRQSQQQPIPRGHVEEINRLAELQIGNIDGSRPATFSSDPHMDAVFGSSFRSHFPKVASELDEWSRLLEIDRSAETAVDMKIGNATGNLNADHGLNVDHVKAVFRRAIDSQLVSNPGPVPLPAPRVDALTPYGSLLMLGGSSIAASTSIKKLEAAGDAFTAGVAAIANWPELGKARAARLQLAEHRNKLRPDLIEITHSHALPRSCRLCGTGRG